ncbi:MAG: response regulator [Hyphomonadaceae bacterium]
MRVLIADDHLANRRLLAHIAAAQGWRAVCVEDGAAAVRACQSDEPFDAILLDRRMPQVTGEDAARAIRAMGGWAEKAAIVGVTADFSGDIREACIAAGMDECLAKPLDCAMLVKAVRRFAPIAPLSRAVA